MFRPQRQRAIAAILAGVVSVSHPQGRAIDQRHSARQCKASLACLLIQITGHKAPQSGQRMGEIYQTGELRLGLCLGPFLVIAVLLAVTCITPSGQQMPVRERRHPHVFISRRHRHRLEPRAFRAAGNRCPVWRFIGEPAPVALAGNAGAVIPVIGQSRAAHPVRSPRLRRKA